jgi:hypothetical protein
VPQELNGRLGQFIGIVANALLLNPEILWIWRVYGVIRLGGFFCPRFMPVIGMNLPNPGMKPELSGVAHAFLPAVH